MWPCCLCCYSILSLWQHNSTWAFERHFADTQVCRSPHACSLNKCMNVRLGVCDGAESRLWYFVSIQQSRAYVCILLGWILHVGIGYWSQIPEVTAHWWNLSSLYQDLTDTEHWLSLGLGITQQVHSPIHCKYRTHSYCLFMLSYAPHRAECF